MHVLGGTFLAMFVFLLVHIIFRQTLEIIVFIIWQLEFMTIYIS